MDTFVIVKVVSVVVVWLASDCLIALRLQYVQVLFVLWSVAIRFSSITVAALTVTCVQVPCPVLTACQVQLHHQERNVQDAVA